jgi:PadR family transcriptional regulator PadR
MPAPSTELVRGTLELMVLRALASRPLHGLGISRRIEQVTRGTFRVKPGSLFPALHRLEAEGYLLGTWGESENNRRARFYRLTRAGERRLESNTRRWNRIALAIGRALAVGP